MTSAQQDQVHYNAVRRALENGNAAVMVGAGFSKNAENGDELAMWHEIAQELWRELNPGADDLTNFSATTVTQLGEQYARVFSKPALEELLKRLIPDERVAPGLLHRQLLSLPWSEIFTTNYDTLLERTAESVVDKAHYTVMCREDIPQSKILDRRRIVKLHGSFPSQRPFIFTEEDYRRYPEKSAPFINLVRQSMLENVFCLIGFSGDDPNFLHWIGWVRDMLDEHALPIYLFVLRQPSLGTLKLLESRRVTPVILPTIDRQEQWDYSARFATLFEILKKPLTAEVEDWGKKPTELSLVGHGPLSPEQRLAQVVTAYSSIRIMRNDYPGWFVAPYSVRKRFFYTTIDLHNAIYFKETQDKFATSIPHVGVVILAEYAWHLDVLLQCMNDDIAELALRILDQTTPQAAKFGKTEIEPLKELGADTPQEFQQRWKELALSVLRWAREALRESQFEEIKSSLLRNFSTDLQVADQITYEEILLNLYSGDRDIAHKSLKDWDIQTPDSYMLVRKGMLLGELGEVTPGLEIAVTGLKRLRKNQRSRINSTLYLSQEAWACMAIGYIHDSIQVSFNKKKPTGSLEYLPEDVTKRLIDLAALGHDVRKEVLQLTADLDAETPAPSQPITYTPLFELGRYSTTRHLGSGHSYSDKIHAAFAWLTLSDRVSLVPRVGNATFDIGSFGQAAWWVQHADSMQRVLSVMMRLLNNKMLEPRKPTQLVHSAGWLSRYQVAKTPESLAQQLFERSMDFVERMFPREFESDMMERTIKFHMQVISRLIIRITTPGFAYDQLNRVISMFKSKQMLLHPSLWEETSYLIKHCFEALSPPERLQAVPLLASIPDHQEVGVNDKFHKSDWINLHNLHRRNGDLILTKTISEIDAIVNDLIDRLVVGNTVKTEINSEDPTNTESIWARLFWLKQWGGVSKSQSSILERLLFSKKEWPIIPEHHSWAAMVWVSSNRKKTIHKRYHQWILKQRLESFSSTRTNTEGTLSRSWGIRNPDILLADLIYSLEESIWSEEEMSSALFIMKTWWNEEWQHIKPELGRLDEVRKMLLARMKLIDRVIATFIDQYSLSALVKRPELFAWLEEMQKAKVTDESMFLCTGLACAFEANNLPALAKIEGEILLRLFNSDISGANYIAKIITYWTRHPNSKKIEAPSGLIYSLAGVVSARRMPILPWALDVMAEIVEQHPNWITPSCYALLNVGLEILLSEVAYVDRPDGTGIPDDNIPILRYSCVRLSRALRGSTFYGPGDASSRWLKETQHDPLPEMRFMEV